jgi:hypothetical protein
LRAVGLRTTFLALTFFAGAFLTIFFAADFLTDAFLAEAFFIGLFLAIALRAVFLTAPFFAVDFFAALFFAAAFRAGFLVVAFRRRRLTSPRRSIGGRVLLTRPSAPVWASRNARVTTSTISPTVPTPANSNSCVGSEDLAFAVETAFRTAA